MILFSLFFRYIVSDCDSVDVLYNQQHYTKTPEDAAAITILAGKLASAQFIRLITVLIQSSHIWPKMVIWKILTTEGGSPCNFAKYVYWAGPM